MALWSIQWLCDEIDKLNAKNEELERRLAAQNDDGK